MIARGRHWPRSYRKGTGAYFTEQKILARRRLLQSRGIVIVGQFAVSGATVALRS